MRLINTTTMKLEEFFEDVPPYAILSHTWGSDETTFQDMQRGDVSLRTRSKVRMTCEIALECGLKYAWIDTCCIDKTSSAELTESINSMYEFYKLAEVCLVYLSDLPAKIACPKGIKHCKWITRGWTLQEMIASPVVEFYDEDWELRGSKLDFCQELSEYTGVPKDVLRMKATPAQYSIAQRMSWASRRNTTRLEDMAYCLLGIFNVNMPLIYGERQRAFQRLQEQIIKGTNDTTIFAWNPTDAEAASPFCSLFASSPANFSAGRLFRPWGKYFNDPEYTLTNKGLRMEDRIYYVPKGDGLKREYVLPVTIDKARGEGSHLGVHLRKVGPDLFMRETRELEHLGPEIRKKLSETPEAPFYIMTERVLLDSNILEQTRKRGLRVFVKTSPKNLVPQGLWDSLDCCFFPNKSAVVRGIDTRIKLNDTTTNMGILLRWWHVDGLYTCRLFDSSCHKELSTTIFLTRHHSQAKQGIRWAEVDSQFPEVKDFTNVLRIKKKRAVFVITGSFEPEHVEGFDQLVPMQRFVLRVRQETSDGTLVREMDGMDLLF